MVFQQIEHRIRIRKRLTACLILQALHDVACCGRTDVREHERLLERLPEFVVQVRATVQKDVHLLLELIARTLQPLADTVEKAHADSLLIDVRTTCQYTEIRAPPRPETKAPLTRRHRTPPSLTNSRRASAGPRWQSTASATRPSSRRPTAWTRRTGRPPSPSCDVGA